MGFITGADLASPALRQPAKLQQTPKKKPCVYNESLLHLGTNVSLSTVVSATFNPPPPK